METNKIIGYVKSRTSILYGLETRKLRRKFDEAENESVISKNVFTFLT